MQCDRATSPKAQSPQATLNMPTEEGRIKFVIVKPRLLTSSNAHFAGGKHAVLQLSTQLALSPEVAEVTYSCLGALSSKGMKGLDLRTPHAACSCCTAPKAS